MRLNDRTCFEGPKEEGWTKLAEGQQGQQAEPRQLRPTKGEAGEE